MTKKLSLSEENLLELETDKNTKEKEIEMVWSLYFSVAMEPGKTIQGNVRNINRGKLEGLDEGKSWKSKQRNNLNEKVNDL